MFQILLAVPLATMAYKLGEKLYADYTISNLGYVKCFCCDSRISPEKQIICNGEYNDYERNLVVCVDCATPVEEVKFKDEILVPGGYCRKTEIAVRDASAALRLAELRIRDLEEEESNKFWNKVEQFRPQIDAVKKYSASYEGRVPPAKLGKRIESGWFYERNDAELALKALAFFEGCSVVQQVTFEQQGDNGYRRVSSLFKASGLI